MKSAFPLQLEKEEVSTVASWSSNWPVGGCKETESSQGLDKVCCLTFVVLGLLVSGATRNHLHCHHFTF